MRNIHRVIEVLSREFWQVKGSCKGVGDMLSRGEEGGFGDGDCVKSGEGGGKEGVRDEGGVCDG